MSSLGFIYYHRVTPLVCSNNPPPQIANHDYDFGAQKHLETHPNPCQQPESSSVKTSTWSINNLRTDSPMGECGKLWWNNKVVRISKYKVGPKKSYQ